MTDVINPKRASPDQLLPYHKKISAEGKAQMICFISYTYMVLKRAFRKRLKKSRHKKRTRRVLMESLLEFTSDEGKEQVSRLPPMDTLHPENYGDAAGGFAQQSA